VLATEKHDEFSNTVQVALSTPTLRLYTIDDLIGAELGGALKNVYAIAAGMCDGLGLGDNAKAALVTRVLAEMIRIGETLGARSVTFVGLSGFGDLIATCYGEWSRNHEFGFKIGRGHTIDELMQGRRTVVEGYRTTESVYEVCASRLIDAPILDQIHAILFRGRKPADGVAALMTRELKREQAPI
jgi:glycerol-3-phosphate dehydrogenase (NAD(P)+)